MNKMLGLKVLFCCATSMLTYAMENFPPSPAQTRAYLLDLYLNPDGSVRFFTPEELRQETLPTINSFNNANTNTSADKSLNVHVPIPKENPKK